jgi:hypothetical protein
MDQPHSNVIRFKNRTGSASWRVTGYLGGVRLRKNFASREEAAAEKTSLEIRAIQAAKGQRAAVTSLNDVQLREAESIFHRIADKPRSLSFYVDYALANYREPEHRVGCRRRLRCGKKAGVRGRPTLQVAIQANRMGAEAI